MKATFYASQRTAFLAIILASLAVTVRSDTLDDFEDPILGPDWSQHFARDQGTAQITTENGQLKLGVGALPDNPVVWIKNTANSYVIEDGRTLEFTVDLISANQQGAAVGLVFSIGDMPGDPLAYAIYVDSDRLFLAKSNQQIFEILDGVYPRDNVRMVLRMTGEGSDVILQGQLLDLDDGTILFEKSVRDTSGADPMDVGTDSPPASYLGMPGRFNLALWHRPEAPTTGGETASEAILDNAAVNQYVAIAIEKAILLRFQDPGTPYVIEGAKSLEGPWEVVDAIITADLETGFQSATVPAPSSIILQFFRLSENDAP